MGRRTAASTFGKKKRNTTAATGRELARTEELPRMSGGANISTGFGGRVYFPGVDGKLYEITVQNDDA